MKCGFPEVAIHADPVDHDKIEVNRHAHGIDMDFEVVKEHAAPGDPKTGTCDRPIWREHMIFEMGPKGAVLVRDECGDPVDVAGSLGKGRVVFAGSCQGNVHGPDPEGSEQQADRSILDWPTGAIESEQ